MKVKLQEYALLAEIISAIAIVISLVFVGLQIRDNTVASEASTYEAIASNDLELLTNVSASPELSRIFEAYMWDASASLTENELVQGQWQMLAALRHLENIYFQYKAGMLSDEAWATRAALLKNNVESPGFERLMKGNKLGSFSGSFIDYVMLIRDGKDVDSNY